MARPKLPAIAIALAGLVGLAALLVAGRYWRGDAKQPVAGAIQPPATTPASASPSTIPATRPPIPGGSAPRPASASPPEAQEQPVAEASDVSPPASTGPSPPAHYATERLLIFAPRNPLIIEFQFSIDGRPHSEALDQLVAQTLKLADTDNDGRPLWKEITASKRFRYGQFGNLPVNNENDHKQIVERYDIDRDGTVDATELPRFLTRNAGGARAFSTRGTLDYRDLNRRGASTWQLVDADDDGLLSAPELAGMATRLISRDLDDNEVLAVSEMRPQTAMAMPGMARERRRRGADATRLLGPHADWDSVRSLLEYHYSGSRALAVDSFPLTPELFTQLDKNGDGRVLRDEFAGLNDIEPHLVVAVDFGSPPADRENEAQALQAGEPSSVPPMKENSAPTQIRLVRIVDALTAGAQEAIEQPNRLTLAFGGMVLTLYRNDTLEAADFEAQAQQALTALDANKDGYLEKSEVPENMRAQLGQFEAVDADEDGKAYAGEIVTYLRQQQAALRSQIHAKVGDRDDALFAALDADHDERLDSREIKSASQRLATLDRDADGHIAPDELPEPLLIGLARGNLENMDALFVPPPLVARGRAENAPRWFTAMDANADGAISRREFVGEEEPFARLDANGNGLLEASEIAATAGP